MDETVPTLSSLRLQLSTKLEKIHAELDAIEQELIVDRLEYQRKAHSLKLLEKEIDRLQALVEWCRSECRSKGREINEWGDDHYDEFRKELNRQQYILEYSNGLKQLFFKLRTEVVLPPLIFSEEPVKGGSGSNNYGHANTDEFQQETSKPTEDLSIIQTPAKHPTNIGDVMSSNSNYEDHSNETVEVENQSQKAASTEMDPMNA